MINILFEVISICLVLAIDVSIISLNYGLSKIKIPFISALSIALLNLIAAGIGILISILCENFINEIYLDYISIALLFSLGLFNLILYFKRRHKNISDKNLDVNNDKKISPSEAVFLSLILIPDGFCASLACGSNDFFIISFLTLFFITTLLSVTLFSSIGLKLSRKIKHDLSFLSPCFLIIFSLIKLILLLV